MASEQTILASGSTAPAATFAREQITAAPRYAARGTDAGRFLLKRVASPGGANAAPASNDHAY